MVYRELHIKLNFYKDIDKLLIALIYGENQLYHNIKDCEFYNAVAQKRRYNKGCKIEIVKFQQRVPKL